MINNAATETNADGGYYTRSLSMPKNKQEGLANFVQMIINAIERGEVQEALLTAVDLLSDITSEAGPYKTEEKLGHKLKALQSELQAKHSAELIAVAKKEFENGQRAAKEEMRSRLGL